MCRTEGNWRATENSLSVSIIEWGQREVFTDDIICGDGGKAGKFMKNSQVTSMSTRVRESGWFLRFGGHSLGDKLEKRKLEEQRPEEGCRLWDEGVSLTPSTGLLQRLKMQHLWKGTETEDLTPRKSSLELLLTRLGKGRTEKVPGQQRGCWTKQRGREAGPHTDQAPAFPQGSLHSSRLVQPLKRTKPTEEGTD